MRKLLCFIILTHIQLSISTSQEVDCAYQNNHYDVFGSIYQCKVVGDLTITLKDQSTITSASLNHSALKTNDDVLGFVSENKYMRYFPSGLEKVFKNLQLIHIKFTYIQELTQADMKPFPELMELDLHDNEIKILEDELFKYNPKLVFVSFSSNKIIHIGLTAFDGLNNLIYLYLTSNACISSGAYRSHSQVLDIIEYAKIQCISSEFKEIDENLNELYNDVVIAGSDKLQENIQNIEAELKSSDFSSSSVLKVKLEKLKNVKVLKNIDQIRESKPHSYINIVIVLSIAVLVGIVVMFIRRK
ncbi:leucine-rich repeat-containing protein 24-like [Chironomus tepperi]|uniref:leucine-rich repeat-containing protein 24-like n=1 Tax=Chironomus tepperi TaxID=113505 RepID=UPI00391EEA3B